MLGALLIAAGCSSSPEQQLLQRYFQASKLRDNTTLNNIATVAFSPTEQGAVQSFEVVSVEPEQRRPLKLRELATAEEEARNADEAFNKKRKEYQDRNLGAIERVLKAERTNSSVRGADAQVQKTWSQLRDDGSQFSKKLADARRALVAERSLAEVSVYDARNPVDTTKFDGELVTKDMQIRAQVRTPEGSMQDKDLYVRFTRAELTNGPEGKTIPGRWIITNIGETRPAGSPSS
jgi:hypothetical protein